MGPSERMQSFAVPRRYPGCRQYGFADGKTDEKVKMAESRVVVVSSGLTPLGRARQSHDISRRATIMHRRSFSFGTADKGSRQLYSRCRCLLCRRGLWRTMATRDDAMAHKRIALSWREGEWPVSATFTVDQRERLGRSTCLTAVCGSCVDKGHVHTGGAAKLHWLGDPG